jgi:hypothetical protein
LVGEVAVVVVLVLEVVVVGVVEVVVVLVEVDVVVGVDALVGVEAVEEVRWTQSLTASRAIVLAPWLRLLRSVGFTVAGSVRTSWFNDRLALRAAGQFPEAIAESIWSACPLRAID